MLPMIGFSYLLTDSITVLDYNRLFASINRFL